MTVLINLVGEQPLPNLLPVKLEQPDTVVLIHSTLTEKVAPRLEKLILGNVHLYQVDAYNIGEVAARLDALITEKQWPAEEVVINLTGGTKPMSLGAFQTAIKYGLRAIYLKTEPPATLYSYDFSQGIEATSQLLLENLPPVLDLHTFIRAFRDADPYIAGSYCKTEPGYSFEKAVHQVLQDVADEVMIGVKLDDVVDIDFLVRTGNTVAVIECKTGKNGLKTAIDQLNTAGGHDYLGTYTKKVLVSNIDWATSSNLKRVASERRIEVIELSDYSPRNAHLSPTSADLLTKSLEKLLGKKRSV